MNSDNGVVQVDAAALDTLRRQASAVRAADQEHEHTALVAAAVDDGRIAEHRRGFWLNRLRNSPRAAAAALELLTPGTAHPYSTGEWFGE